MDSRFCDNLIPTLIRVDRFQIHDVPNDIIFVTDSISTKHIASHTCNVQRFTGIISLYQ